MTGTFTGANISALIYGVRVCAFIYTIYYFMLDRIYIFIFENVTFKMYTFLKTGCVCGRLSWHILCYVRDTGIDTVKGVREPR